MEHKSSHKQHRYICSNSQQYIVWVKIINFYFMTKISRILRSCSMKIFSEFPTVNISKFNFWLVICIAKNFIWATLNLIFSIFWFLCTLKFQILNSCISGKYWKYRKSYPNKPCINGKLIYSAYILCINLNFNKSQFCDWFEGHVC